MLFIIWYIFNWNILKIFVIIIWKIEILLNSKNI